MGMSYKRRGCIRVSVRRYISPMVAVLLLVMAGCGKQEAVITPNGEDITEPVIVYDKLETSVATKFNYDDLVVGNIKYNMTAAEVEAVYGKPDKVIDVAAKSQDEQVNAGTTAGEAATEEKVYVYGSRVMGFYNVEGTYRLVSVESSEAEDTFARGLKTGDTLDDILKAYFRDENCMNNNYYSADNTAALGKFLYGSYTMDALDSVKPTDDVAYGVINYNGYANYEEAKTFIVEFTYFKAPYKAGYATTSDDFGQIAFDMDQDKKITAIRWYYYPELS